MTERPLAWNASYTACPGRRFEHIGVHCVLEHVGVHCVHEHILVHFTIKVFG